MTGSPARREATARALGAAGAPSVIAALLLPLLGVAALTAAGWLDREAAIGSATLRAWVAALGAALAARGGAALLRRRWAALGLAGAGLVALLHLVTWELRRFDATWDLGVGEPAVAPRVDVAGSAARPPAIVAREIAGRPEEGAVVALDGRPVSLAPGREIDVGGGRRIVLQGIYAAPSFRVARASGATEGEGLLKFAPGERGYFQVSLLPHRFYVTLPAAGAAESPARMDHLSLEVYRGKVRVAKAERLPFGEPLEFEGLVLTMERGGWWARVRVRAVQDPTLLWVAALLALLSGVAHVRRRGGAR